jgi:hypothetical protein
LEQRTDKSCEVATFEQVPAYPGCGSGFDIVRFVADEETGFFPHRPTIKTIQNDAQRQLTPIARPPPLLARNS